MSYFPSINQSVQIDINNSVLNTSLTADQIWNSSGVGTSTLGVNAIQIVVSAAKNMHIYVDQGRSNSSFQITDEYDYIASTGNFGITVQAVAAYVRVRVKNTSLEADSTVSVDTVLCPIVEALPRSLDDHGCLKVGIDHMGDTYGFEAECTPTGELRVSEPTRLVGANFDGTTIDSIFWATAASGTGAISQGNAQLSLSSGTTSGNTVTAYTTRRARYIGGCGMRYRAIIRTDAGIANNTRRWGIGWGSSAMPTVTDGAYFQMLDTTFSIVTNKGGTSSAVDSGSFNGVLGLVYSPAATVQTYEIYWTNSKVYFVIGGEILHTVSASSTTWANTMNFYVFMDNINTGTAANNVTLNVRTASIYRLGKLLTAPISYYHAYGTTVASGVQLKLGLGNIHRITIQAANQAVITLADSTSGLTPIIYATTGIAAITQPISIDLGGVPFSNGLRLGVTAGSAQCTVIYE